MGESTQPGGITSELPPSTADGGSDDAPERPERNGPPVRAVLSDIHGNLEALEAVLADIDRRNAKGAGIGEILCLGDVVGYGPNPLECLRRVLDRCAVTIEGNHEAGVLAKVKQPDLTLSRASGYGGRGAREGILWAIHQLYGDERPVGGDDGPTRELLEEMGREEFVASTVGDFCEHDGGVKASGLGLRAVLGGGGVVRKVVEALFATPESRGRLERCLHRIRERDEGERWIKRLSELPVRAEVGNALLVHDNPFDPGDSRYVLRAADAEKFSIRRGYHSVDKVFRDFDWSRTDVVFLGHSHVPGVYTDPKQPGKLLANPGSVGIPRGGRSTASYALWDSSVQGKKAIKLVKLPLARLEETRRKMEKAGLPDKFGDPAALKGEPG